MSKFVCLLVCVVAIITNVYSISDESKAVFQEAIKAATLECAEAHGVSEDEIKSAKEAKSSAGLKPCFLGCLLKKFGIINDRGLFDIDAGLDKLRQVIKNKDDIAQIEEGGKKCLSVNDQAVGDGEAGCERAQLLMPCLHQHKGGIAL